MANLPEPDWLTLFESAKRTERAFGTELSAVEAALIDAFHDGKIHARGRCRSFFGHNTLLDLARYTWDRADVIWQGNEFAIPDDRLGRRLHIFSDVVVCRDDLEAWINGAIPDSQQAEHDAPRSDVTPPLAPVNAETTDIEAEYARRVNDYRVKTGRSPTFEADNEWRKSKGLKRDALRDLRQKNRTDEEKKGGHPPRS